MNSEIEKFKYYIEKCDFYSNLGYSGFKQNLFNENTENEFFQYELKNDMNKIIQFTYYPCNRLITSNEITMNLIYPNGGSTNLSGYLAYKKLKKRLKYEDILAFRFKVDCDLLEKSILTRLKQISDILHGEFKKYLVTEDFMVIPMYDPRDDY
jgi:hypothetical protein